MLERCLSSATLLVCILGLIKPSSPFILRTPALLPNIRKLYYSNGLQDYLGSPEFNSTLPGDDVILDAYDSWRRQYNKGEYSHDRFENFKVNYKTLMTANAATTRRSHSGESLEFPSYLSLNEYGDCSIEEYKSILASGGELASRQSSNPFQATVQYDQPTITKAHGVNDDSLEWDISDGESAIEKEIRNEEANQNEVRRLYEAWCEEKGKPFDESRLPVFAEHYLKAVEYCAQTNKPLKLNEFADLTTEEYNALSFQERQPKSLRPAPNKPVNASVNAGMSAGSYLDSISKGTIATTYFGEEKEIKEEDLASLFSRLNEAKEVEDEAKIQARRAEVAALEAREVARIKEEEQARLNAAEEARRQQTLEDSRLKEWEEARRKAEVEAKQRAGGVNEEPAKAQKDTPSVAFRPMTGSYMGAVAKTWESRSEYLAQLESSTKYLESLQDVPPSELPKMYDELDALTGSIPTGQDSSDSKKAIPKLDFVETHWKDEEVDKELKQASDAETAQIKDTTDATTRRQRDEMAARRARDEAEEWMRIQKQLEEQADLARQRREREEKALLEAQKKAKELEAANLEREQRLKEMQAVDTDREANDALGMNRVKQLQETTEKALREAAKLKEEFQNLNPSQGLSILSFFANNKAIQNGQESKQNLRLEAQRERNEIQNHMAARDRKTQAEEKKGLFNWFQRGSTDKPKTLALISIWSQNEDGSISGIVEESSTFTEGVRITTSPIRGRAYEGSVVETLSGSRYALGEKFVASAEGASASDLLRSTMDFFDGLQTKRETALLYDWQLNDDGTLTGLVSKKKGFNDGTKITTSPVTDEVGRKIVKTLGGSYYRLL